VWRYGKAIICAENVYELCRLEDRIYVPDAPGRACYKTEHRLGVCRAAEFQHRKLITSRKSLTTYSMPKRKSFFFKLYIPLCVVLQRKKQMVIKHNNIFIKYQYSYMFRRREVIVVRTLEYFNILHISKTAGFSNSCRLYNKTDASM